LPGSVILDGADEQAFSRGGVEDGFHQVRGGRLAVGTGDADKLQSIFRMLVEIRTDAGERAASMRDYGPGDACARRFAGGVGDDCDRAGAERGVDVAIAVCVLTAHGEEQPSGLDAARVVVQSLEVRAARLAQ